MHNRLNLLLILSFLYSCNWYRQTPDLAAPNNEIIKSDSQFEVRDTLSKVNQQWDYQQKDLQVIKTGNTSPKEVVKFSKTLIGIPYKYASSNPDNGFDCSGFITYVFNHFQIAVPRSSADFTTVEKTIPINQATEGDLILFTGTDSTIRKVGHMGIVTSKKGEPITFIHSTSGKEYGVTITPLNPYYQGRFAGIRRIFN